jgi:WD40 repeat protein
MVTLWSLDGSGAVATLAGHNRAVAQTVFAPDGSRLATGASDGLVKLWDASGKELATLKKHTRIVKGVAFSPDGTRLASVGADGMLVIWDAAAGTLLHSVQADTHRLNAVVWTDAHTIATGGEDPAVHLWDADTGAPKGKFAGHTEAVFALAVSPDGTRLASGSGDATIRIWDLASGKSTTTLTGHTQTVLRVVFVPWANVLYSAGLDKKVLAWDLGTGKDIASGLTIHEAPVVWLDCRPSGRTIAVAEADGLVDVVNLDDPARTPTLFSAGTEWVVASPDGHVDASAGGRTRLLWRAGPYVLPWYAGWARYGKKGLLADFGL